MHNQFGPQPASIHDLRSELQRFGDVLVERLCHEIGSVIRKLQHTVPPPAQHCVEPGEGGNTTTAYCFFKDPGGVWHISVPPNPERLSHVADCVGFSYSQTLLRAYPIDLSACQVQALAAHSSPGAVGHNLGEYWDERKEILHGNHETFQAQFDEKTKQQIHERLNYLRCEMEKAHRNNDNGQLFLLGSEEERLLVYINNAVGKHDRKRQMSTAEARAHDAVRHGIARAILLLSKIDTNAAEFIRNHIRVGRTFCYNGPEVCWRFHK